MVIITLLSPLNVTRYQAGVVAIILLSAAGRLPAAGPGFVQNASTRVAVGAGQSAIISGFIVSGGTQTLIVRALGPTLARYGVSGVLLDPVLELHNSTGAVIAINDNWGDTQGALFRQGGTYRAFQPPSELEPAIAVTLPPGAYTAVIHGKNGGTGVALAEVYAASPSSTATLSNISARAFVGTGSDVLIGGITIVGGSNVGVILRALGPSLARFGVTNVLANPVLELHDRDGTLIGYSDNWQNDADQATRISRAGYAPASSLEPAISVTLPPGSYTAVVRGAANSTGMALLEVYQTAQAESASCVPATIPTPPPTILPPLPRGVFSLVNAGGAINSTVLANPSVDGVSLRQAWTDLEPAEGEYNWAYLDAQIARAGAAGKQVILRVGTGSDNIPAWVMTAVRNAGGTTFTFTDSVGRHTIPVFWDPTFVAKKNAMTAAVGARYSANSALKVFSPSFANASSNDWAVPHNNTVDPGYAISEVLRWENAGYTSQKLINAGKSVIDAAMRAFPNQLISLAINSNGGALDSPNDDNYVAQTVISNARSLWGGGRLIVAKNSLSDTTPPAPSAPGTSTALWYAGRPAVAGQALWFSYGDPAYRNSGGRPIAAATSLQQLINIGATYGLGYVELYEVDVVNLPSVIAYAHTVLIP